MKNNEMITIRELNDFLKENEVYIPLLQRNYKWPAEDKNGGSSAKKLLDDLYASYRADKQKKYTLGMVTLYTEESGKIQIIDGQQRVITLKLLFGLLADETYLPIGFERDEGLEDEMTRRYFLENIGKYHEEKKEQDIYTDIARMQTNYQVMKSAAEEKEDFEKEKNEFASYILDKVYILSHMTESEPLDEFLNINKNKTRFLINDYIKAELIIDSGKDERHEILTVFDELAASFYRTDNVWQCVSRGYLANRQEEKDSEKWHVGENRLKILFVDRYKDGNRLGYEYHAERKVIKKYKNIMESLSKDIAAKNYILNNMYIGYYENTKGDRFFKICDEADEGLTVEEVIVSKAEKRSPYLKNILIQAVMEDALWDGKEAVNHGIKEADFNDLWEPEAVWVYAAEEEWEYFKFVCKEYLEQRYCNEG